MKMAFEASLIAFLSMFFLSLGINLVNVVVVHQKALQIEEYAIIMIENHNRYDAEIYDLIKTKLDYCAACKLEVSEIVGDESISYEVSVAYSVGLPMLNLKIGNTFSAITAS